MDSLWKNTHTDTVELYAAAEDCTNLTEAFRLYKKAAEQGHPGAQCKLGMCYFLGTGVNKSVDEAENWFLKSAKAGDADGQYALGCFYFNNLNKSNIDAAVYYLELSANQGHKEAESALNMVMLQRDAQAEFFKNAFGI